MNIHWVLLNFLCCTCCVDGYTKTSENCARFNFPSLDSTLILTKVENTTLQLRFQLIVDNKTCPDYNNGDHFIFISKQSKVPQPIFCILKVNRGWECSVAYNENNCWCGEDQAWNFVFIKNLTKSDNGTWTWKTEKTTVQKTTVDFNIEGHSDVNDLWNTTSEEANVSKDTVFVSMGTHEVSLPENTTVESETGSIVVTAVTAPVSAIVIILIILIIIQLKRKTVQGRSTTEYPAPPPCYLRERASDSFGSMHTHHYFEIDENPQQSTAHCTRDSLTSSSDSVKSISVSQCLDFIACPSTDSDSDSYAIACDIQASNMQRVTVHATVHPMSASEDRKECPQCPSTSSKIKTVEHTGNAPNRSAPSKNTDKYIHPVVSVFESAIIPRANAFLKSTTVPEVTSNQGMSIQWTPDTQRAETKVASCNVAASPSTSTSECTPQVALAQSEVSPSNATGSPGGHWTQNTPWVPPVPWMASALWTTAPWAHPLGTLYPGEAVASTPNMRFQDAHDTGPHTNREQKPVATVRTIYTGESAAAFSVRFNKNTNGD